jgi:thiosulfate/3-mercaptopyruvate sulfurtransferase
LHWLVEAAAHLEPFSRYHVYALHVEQVQMDDLFAWRNVGTEGEVTEDEAIKRRSRSPHGVWVALAPGCTLILAVDVGERPLAMAQRLVHHVPHGLVAAHGDAATPTASDGYANASLLVTAHQAAGRRHERAWRVVDVRSPEQYASGHLPGAVNLPLGAITRTRHGTPGMLTPLAEITQALGERGISRETQVVIYDNVGGPAATRLFWVLDALGHPRVSVFQGGLHGWRQAGLPVSQELPEVQPTMYEATWDRSKVATLGWVATHAQHPNVVLLDARSPAEFSGQVPGRQVKRPGHIPEAVNVDWVNNLTAEPRQFRAGTELAHLYQRAGVTPDNEIVVYCRTGMRASHTYFVLRLLGYPRVRVYDGSYVEWAAEPTVPVAR